MPPPNPADVRHDAHRQRQRRHQVAIGSDDKTRFFALRIELEHAFLLVVAVTRRPEARQKAAFDRGHVGRLESERCAEVVVRSARREAALSRVLRRA